MKLIWEIDTAVPPGLIALMQTAADCALWAAGVKRPCAAGVRLCGDEAIRAANQAYRGIDRATDVLSFPTVDYPPGVRAGQADKLLRRELDDELDACMLGDVIISLPHVLAQAEAYGHSPQREAAYLLVHGLCHLMGYDHMEADEQKEMRAMEEKILSAVGMDRAGGGAVDDQALLALARAAMERSYVPYSHYPVGAALLCEDGRVFQGCNIENAAFGVTNCAERTALFTALCQGAREFRAIAIAARGSAPWPCGACRQALNEFAPQLRVLVTWGAGETDGATLDQLLPQAFGPAQLAEK